MYQNVNTEYSVNTLTAYIAYDKNLLFFFFK